MQLVQGTQEWLELRKTKITATDSCVIMGSSHWKTKIQLYNEKISDENNTFMNDAMKRGLELEPIARSLFTIQTGIEVEPKVVIKDWAMASLDGISECGKHVVEIKCPGEKDHATALKGKVPEHYYPQLQHQMWVCDVEKMYYFSFDGADGVIVEVVRDPFYLEKMIAEEYKFFMCIQNKTPPAPEESDYIERNDSLWEECVSNWMEVSSQIKELEKQEEEFRKQLIFLSGESNTKGSGISLCKVERKGVINYSKIECLKSMDLEPYRNASSSSWRITKEK